MAASTPLTRLERVARTQRGFFTLRQALAAGFARSTIARRLHRGAWVQLAPRVYRAVPHPPLDWIDRLALVTLSRGAAAAFDSAAALWGLVDVPREPEFQVIRGHRRAGLHSTIVFPRGDLTYTRGVRVTTPVRTVIDACRSRPYEDAVDLVDRAVNRRLVNAARLERRARELWAPRRRGCAHVLRALASQHPDLRRARNDWEAKVLRLCDRYGLPRPDVNLEVVVNGHRYFLDHAWSRAMVLHEFDGYDPHSGRRAHDYDRVRRNELVAAGWLPFASTSTDVTRRPAATFLPIARAVQERLRARG